MDNEANIPDFILADYLVSCLRNLGTTTRQIRNWYAPGEEL